MKTPLTELIEWMEQNQYFIGNYLYAKQKELLEKEREIAQEYVKQSKQDEVNDNPHLGYKTALVPDELLKFQLQEKQEEVKCDQDNGLREAAEKVVDYALYGGLGVNLHDAIVELEKALNQNK